MERTDKKPRQKVESSFSFCSNSVVSRFSGLIESPRKSTKGPREQDNTFCAFCVSSRLLPLVFLQKAETRIWKHWQEPVSISFGSSNPKTQYEHCHRTQGDNQPGNAFGDIASENRTSRFA